MSTLVISSAIWFGYEFTTYIIKSRFQYLVRISIGASFGFAFQSFLFFITSIFFPLNRIHAITVSILLFLLTGLLSNINSRYKPTRHITYSILDIIILLITSIFICIAMYEANLEQGLYTRGPSFADLPFHMNIVSSFSYGINFNRTSIFDIWSCFQADIKLAYPVLHNFYISVLVNCNDMTMPIAFQITAFILTFSFVILLHEVFLTFSKDRIVTLLSIPTWLLLGGLGYTMLFYPHYYQQRSNNWILRFSSKHHATWMQPLVHILIPQRSALFSSPLVFTCILCFMRGVKKWDFSYFILAGFCTAFLPQIQVHSFVAIAQFAIATCLLFFPSKKEFWSAFFSWFIYAFISCLIGLPLTYPFWLRESENSSNFIRIQPFWSDNIYGKLSFPLISVWWKSLGPFGMVALLFGWISATKYQLKFWGSSMIVFLITMFVMYQPWKMDNLKLLFAVWLPIVVPFVTQYYVYIWRYSTKALKKSYRNVFVHIFIKIIVVVLMLQNTFSSILSINYELGIKLIFMTKDDYACGNWISENTPIDSIFFSYSSRFNPATAIGGRQLYLGFVSWTAQHGVAGPNRELLTSQLLQDTNNSDFFASEGIQYVLLHVNKSLHFPIKGSNSPWIKVFEVGPYTIFKLNHTNIEPPEHKRNHTKKQESPMLTPLPLPTKKKRKKYIYNFTE